MARTILGAAAAVWIVAGLFGVGFGLLGAGDLQRVLPPLAIDLSALGGAVVAVSLGALTIGLAHAAALVGLRAGHRVARSAAIVMAAALAMLMVTLAVAAATSAVTVPDRAVPLVAAALATLVGAAAYGAVAVLLVAEVRGRSTF